MNPAHRNLSIIEHGLTREDIARLYSEKHAAVWELIRLASMASTMRPPIFEVVSLSVTAGEYLLQSRGSEQIEGGWLEGNPSERESLARKLPEDTETLRRMAAGPLQVEGVDIIETAPTVTKGLSPSDLVRVMKGAGIGRPSTYARHVESMFEATEHGLLSIDEKGQFRLTETGRAILQCLDELGLASLEPAFAAQLDADLEAIERGAKTPAEVLRAHIGSLPGVDIGSKHARAGQDNPASSIATSSPAADHRHAVVLPPEIDPEIMLPLGHPLRAVRAAFDAHLVNRFGHSEPNRNEASKRRAWRAAALGKLLGSGETLALLERIQFDLSWRWVIGLKPNDPVWPEAVFTRFVAEGRDVVTELHDVAKGVRPSFATVDDEFSR